MTAGKKKKKKPPPPPPSLERVLKLYLKGRGRVTQRRHMSDALRRREKKKGQSILV